eukprot:6195983-Pleurochrysis_carterae.AAC.3
MPDRESPRAEGKSDVAEARRVRVGGHTESRAKLPPVYPRQGTTESALQLPGYNRHTENSGGRRQLRAAG